jgi:hypothetical protein
VVASAAAPVLRLAAPLPAHLDAALAGVGLRPVRELAFEVREYSRPYTQRELAAGFARARERLTVAPLGVSVPLTIV